MREETAMVAASAALTSINQRLSAVDFEGMKTQLAGMKCEERSNANGKEVDQYRKKVLGCREFSTTEPFRDLVPHGIASSIATKWSQVTAPLLQLHESVDKLVATRSAHTKAFELGFTTRYKEELKRFGDVGGMEASEAHIKADAYAKLMIGAPPPRVDAQTTLAAVDLSLQIRYILLDVGKSLASMGGARIPPFLYFIVSSSIKDAIKAIGLALESELHRKALEFHVALLRFRFERCHFNVDQAMAGFKKNVSAEDREAICKKVDKASQSAERELDNAVDEFRRSWGGNVERMRDGEEWLEKNVDEARAVVMESWEKLRKATAGETTYEEVTEEERRAVIRAMMRTFGPWDSSAHWYRCPNGHNFVIGDCGQANQAGRCPECGAVVGGQDFHGSRMADGVTLASEMNFMAAQERDRA
ncbi:hypothetical protein MNV49_007490 [Pseudohyphozyma bogoriensis]|nr:hypothetical protein MNV49_007490 [Pseudohyphozyma bogoriensis]